MCIIVYPSKILLRWSTHVQQLVGSVAGAHLSPGKSWQAAMRLLESLRGARFPGSPRVTGARWRPRSGDSEMVKGNQGKKAPKHIKTSHSPFKLRNLPADAKNHKVSQVYLMWTAVPFGLYLMFHFESLGLVPNSSKD